MKKKVCSKCKLTKSISDFHKNKNSSNGLVSSCKHCVKKYQLKNRTRILEQRKQYRLNNRDKIIEWRENNKERSKKVNKKWAIKNRDKLRKNQKNRLKTDIQFKISRNLRKRIWSAINNYTKSNTTLYLLGCSIKDLKIHLEKQFTKGMTWKNYGKWHIDHIKPCASFDMSKEIEQKKCFHYTNLQPLWAKDNYLKGSKI